MQYHPVQCAAHWEVAHCVRLLYILFCLAALIDSPPNCHWPSLEVTFAQSGHSPTQDILYYPCWHLTPEWKPILKSNKAIDTWLMEVLNCLCVYTSGQSNQRLLHWLLWRKNMGTMGSHTSTEQIMQLAAVSWSRVGDKQIRTCLSALIIHWYRSHPMS